MALSAADLARITAEQTQLRVIRANGAGEVTTDGVVVRYHSTDSIDKRLRDIQRTLNPQLRPRVSSLNLQRGWE